MSSSHSCWLQRSHRASRTALRPFGGPPFATEYPAAHVARLVGDTLIMTLSPFPRLAAPCRHLLEKVEQIHTTVRKHLAKEEEQLFPLLLANFSHMEQAQLVAEFLCTIPLAAVERVLSWLKPNVPAAEQQDLLVQVRPCAEPNLLPACGTPPQAPWAQFAYGYGSFGPAQYAWYMLG